MDRRLGRLGELAFERHAAEEHLRVPAREHAHLEGALSEHRARAGHDRLVGREAVALRDRGRGRGAEHAALRARREPRHVAEMVVVAVADQVELRARELGRRALGADHAAEHRLVGHVVPEEGAQHAGPGEERVVRERRLAAREREARDAEPAHAHVGVQRSSRQGTRGRRRAREGARPQARRVASVSPCGETSEQRSGGVGPEV